MIILVSGSSGYVGSFLIKILKEKYKVIGMDLNESHKQNKIMISKQKNITNLMLKIMKSS